MIIIKIKKKIRGGKEKGCIQADLEACIINNIWPS